MNAFDYIKAPLQWMWLLIFDIFFNVLGLFMVAIGIPFAKWGISVSDGRAILNLPRWLHIWGNDFDGLLGDKRGWWAANTPFHVHAESFLAKWWWAAIRNPSNNMRRYAMFSAPITGSAISYVGDYEVEDDVEGSGMQFVKCVSTKGKSYYGFYWVKEWHNRGEVKRGLMVRIGFKVNPRHAGTVDQPKGLTYRLNPWKKL